MPNHVHLLLDFPLGLSLIGIVKGIKQTSALQLKKEFPELRCKLPPGAPLLQQWEVRRLIRSKPVSTTRRGSKVVQYAGNNKFLYCKVPAADQ